MKKQTKEKGLGEANQNQTKERKKPNRSRATQQGKGLQGKTNCPIKWLGVRGKMNNSERARERGTRKKGKTAQTVGSSANDVKNFRQSTQLFHHFSPSPFSTTAAHAHHTRAHPRKHTLAASSNNKKSVGLLGLIGGTHKVQKQKRRDSAQAKK